MGILVTAAILNAIGLVLLLGVSVRRRHRRFRRTALGAWLAGRWSIAIGGLLVFVGVATCAYEIASRA